MSNDLALATLGELFRGPLTQAIGWALVHLLWQGALVAGILAASLGLMRRQSANARYLVCCAALGMVVILAAATSMHVYEPALSAPSDALTTRAVSTPAVPDTSAEVETSLDTSSAGQTLIRFASRHLPVIVLVWMIGVLLLSTRLLWGWISAHRMAARGATPASDHWQSIAIRLSGALQLHRAIQLFESAAVEVPTVIGWLRPAILLPAATLSGLSLEQMEMVLAHELAHVRRNDFFVNLMQAVIETLLFYHPAVWWISSRIRVEREHCCDDIAVSVSGTPLLYARALTRLEELRVPPTQIVLAANGGSLLMRIRRLAGGRSEALNGPSRWVAGAALLMIVTALLIAPSFPLVARTSEAQPPPALAAPRSKPASASVEVRASKPAVEDPEDDDDAPSPADDPNDQDDDQESAVHRFDFDFQFAAPPAPPASSAPPAPPPPAPTAPLATPWRDSLLAPPAVPSLPATPAPLLPP
ncbi:MAG: M56 family metallopeptidase, partial [Thermoanaerobaculia bacterium]